MLCSEITSQKRFLSVIWARLYAAEGCFVNGRIHTMLSAFCSTDFDICQLAETPIVLAKQIHLILLTTSTWHRIIALLG